VQWTDEVAEHHRDMPTFAGRVRLLGGYKAEAPARAFALAPVLRDLQQQGFSLRGMAAELTKRRVPTQKGGAWHPQLVARVLERLSQA
jgi:hypothetical protein